jgi:hypothetical protein
LFDHGDRGDCRSWRRERRNVGLASVPLTDPGSNEESNKSKVRAHHVENFVTDAAGSARGTSRLVAAFKQDIRFTHSADGTRLAYASHGDGYPLVRAAHWLTNIERDWQTPVWRPWFDALGSRYRFYRYDSRGCGLSARETTDVSLDLLVADLEAGCGRARALRVARHVAGRGDLDRVRRSPPRSREPPRAARRVRARPVAPSADARRDREHPRADQADRGWLGPGSPRIPPAVHVADLPECNPRAGQLGRSTS